MTDTQDTYWIKEGDGYRTEQDRIFPMICQPDVVATVKPSFLPSSELRKAVAAMSTTFTDGGTVATTGDDEVDTGDNSGNSGGSSDNSGGNNTPAGGDENDDDVQA